MAVVVRIAWKRSSSCWAIVGQRLETTRRPCAQGRGSGSLPGCRRACRFGRNRPLLVTTATHRDAHTRLIFVRNMSHDSAMPSHWTSSDAPTPRVRLAILVAPGYQPVDIVGIHTAFGLIPGVELHLVWKNMEEVMGMPTFPTRPTTTYADCPRDLDILYAGAVAPEVFEDEETLAFLADRGSRARWVAGSCAGSLLLGAAGLLRGYRATTNFQAVHLLGHVGATYERGNVVEDRNRITAGPATGGFEIAFRLIQDIYGDEMAREVILQAEYAPEPLFATGTPELAGPELTARARAHMAPFLRPLEAVMRRVGARLGTTALEA